MSNPDQSPANSPLQARAVELHTKASMPMSQAEELALSELGIDDAAIDELSAEACCTVLLTLLDAEDVRAFTRAILVHQPAATSTQAVAPAEPMFWVRLRSDGGYEGPIHNDRIERVRKESGGWTPLYPHVAPTEAAAMAATVPADGPADGNKESLTSIVYALARLATWHPTEPILHQINRLADYYADDKISAQFRLLARSATSHSHPPLTPRRQRLVFSGETGQEVPAQAPVADQPAMLRDLLARIHGDGGQYLDQHGLEKATEDADQMVAAWRADQPAEPSPAQKVTT